MQVAEYPAAATNGHAEMPKAVPKPEPFRLNLGCGQSRIEGFVGVDIAQGEATDYLCNLEQYPWPWDDDSVDEVMAIHYAEHVSDFIAFMDEIHRILKIGATATIRGPYYTSIRAFQDPTHVQALSDARFLYFNRGWREQMRLDHYPITSDFDVAIGYIWMPDWECRSQDAKDFALRHYLNVVSDINVILTKRAPVPAPSND